MIRRIDGLPDNVLGFKASGIVTAADYKSMIIPAMETAFAKDKRIRLLYCLGPDFSGFEAAAMWDDAKLGFKHFTGWERVAVVSDVEWLRLAVRVFGLAMPGHVRVFHNDESTNAKRWVAE